MLICVITCEKNRERVLAQKETWVPQASVEVKFFDGQSLGVPDDYQSLPRKTEALCRWALDRGHARILKTDDDSYINFRQFKIVESSYAGIRKPGDYASGGAYWLDRPAMEIIARYGLKDWAEDRGVGALLAEHNIRLTDVPYILPGAGVAAEYGCPCGSDKCKAKNAKPVWEYFPEAAVITQLGPDQMRACHRLYENN